MGDFSGIHIPSKLSARMGMSFTPSFPTCQVSAEDVREEADPMFNGKNILLFE